MVLGVVLLEGYWLGGNREIGSHLVVGWRCSGWCSGRRLLGVGRRLLGVGLVGVGLMVVDPVEEVLRCIGVGGH